MGFDSKQTAAAHTAPAPRERMMQAIVQAVTARPMCCVRRRWNDPRSRTAKCWCGCTRPVLTVGRGTDDRHPYLMRIMGFGFRGPKYRVPGIDVAGTVAAVGSAVTRFGVGDEVFGMSRGSFAEYAAAREDKLAHKPANVSFEQAAVVGISGGTALQALTAGRVTAGQRG